MERLVIAICIVSAALIISLCLLGYYYSEHVADKSMIAMYEAQIKADKAADILTMQLAADALAEQMLNNAHQLSNALHSQQSKHDIELTTQAKQAAESQAAALLEQKNNLTQQAARDLEAAIFEQKDISAAALSAALAAAQITADKAQQAAVDAQKKRRCHAKYNSGYGCRRSAGPSYDVSRC